MILKGKRTFDSLMNAIAKHIATEGDWELDDGVGGEVVFGGGEWTGQLCDDKGSNVVYGVELFNDGYSGEEIDTVEKAISLMEGAAWSKETTASRMPEKRRRPRIVKDKDEGRRSDAEE